MNKFKPIAIATVRDPKDVGAFYREPYMAAQQGRLPYELQLSDTILIYEERIDTREWIWYRTHDNLWFVKQPSMVVIYLDMDVEDETVSEAGVEESDEVHHPPHYTWLPSGIEAIDICEHLNFNLGNAVKYLIRAGKKSSANDYTDLSKAKWYIERELERIKKYEGHTSS